MQDARPGSARSYRQRAAVQARAPDLEAQVRQAVASASRRSTRMSSGGGRAADEIDLDQLQQELTAILGQQLAAGGS